MKILFVGDLSTAKNYGAIATSESLIQLLDVHVANAEVKYIDYRSFFNVTPVDGFGIADETYYSRKNMLKSFLRQRMPVALYRGFKYIKERLMEKPESDIDVVPFKYDQYEDFFLKVEAGKSFGFEKRMVEWADSVFINGEGNIVNGTDKFGKYRKGGLYILFMAWLAKVKYHRATYLVNHTVDPNNQDALEIIKSVYPILDRVLVREKLSLQKLQSLGISNAEYAPDALFSYQPVSGWEASEQLKEQIDFDQPYICIGDSSGIRNAYNQVKWDVVSVLCALVEKAKGVCPQVVFVDGFNSGNPDINEVVKRMKIGVVNLNNCSYHDLFYVLKGARLFVSGRWHASILSVLANTPIILWGSDSHKTRSLYHLLDYPYPFFEISTLPIHIDDMVNAMSRILQETNQIIRLFNQKVPAFRQDVINNVLMFETKN